jgi:CRP-like cAMP-binding protein
LVKKSSVRSSTKCATCPLRSLTTFRAFTPNELKFVQSLKSGELALSPGATVLREGESSPNLYTVLSGWAFRYKMLPDGRRQILNFALPGDFLGLQTTVFKEMDHSVETLTPVVLCTFPRQRMWELYEQHAGLAFDLTWIASREERLLDEQLLSIGRRSAIERISSLMIHLYYRALGSGAATSRSSLRLPLTQQHLSDALGLSLVHTNKTIRKLTNAELIVWKDGQFKILDEKRLRILANYDAVEPARRPLI